MNGRVATKAYEGAFTAWLGELPDRDERESQTLHEGMREHARESSATARQPV